MDRSLSLEQLVEFVESLQRDAAILEFVHYDSLGKNSITPEDYAYALVSFSPVSDGIDRYSATNGVLSFVAIVLNIKYLDRIRELDRSYGRR